MNSEATWPELQGSYGLVLLYKHSPVCFVCAWTMRAVRAFARKYSDIQVRVIDVFEESELSDRISKELDIGHASPQA